MVSDKNLSSDIQPSLADGDHILTPFAASQMSHGQQGESSAPRVRLWSLGQDNSRPSRIC
jgi:hypothetical protein